MHDIILKVLQVLHPLKATGPDEIPAFILKQSANFIAHYISILFQLLQIAAKCQMNGVRQKQCLYLQERREILAI
jgi:hypothetical protein